MKTKKYLRMIHLGLLCSLLSVSCRSYMTLKNKDFIKIDENFNGNYKSASVFIDSIKTKRNTNIQSLFGLKTTILICSLKLIRSQSWKLNIKIFWEEPKKDFSKGNLEENILKYI